MPHDDQLSKNQLIQLQQDQSDLPVLVEEPDDEELLRVILSQIGNVEDNENALLNIGRGHLEFPVERPLSFGRPAYSTPENRQMNREYEESIRRAFELGSPYHWSRPQVPPTYPGDIRLLPEE